MRALRRLAAIIALAALGFGLMCSPITVYGAPALAPVKAGGLVVYNLYATDGYVNLADGGQALLPNPAVPSAAAAPLYIYGFVGGREGQEFKYLKSADPANPYAQQQLITVPAPGAPAPTAGPRVGLEQNLAGNAQFPAPMMWAKAGDVVEIRLKNLGTTNPTAPNDPHSIHLHGTDVDAANDGVPETSVGAVPANLTDDTGAPWPGAGNVVVYLFSPTVAATYFYHCHQEASVHVDMGMYGAFVVYNPNDPAANPPAGEVGGPGTGRGGNLFGFNYDKDYVLLLSDLDVRQHQSEEGVGPYAPPDVGTYNPTDYHPQYWFINGLSFPNTIHADAVVPTDTGGAATLFTWSDWQQAHPNYDPFITGKVGHPGVAGQKVLLRMISMGFETHPMHMHGFHAKVIGSDQRAWPWANSPGTPLGKGMEKNTTTIGSGETYELLLDFNTLNRSAGVYPNNVNPPADLLEFFSGVLSQFVGGTQSRYDPNTRLPVSNGETDKPAIPDPFNVPDGTYTGGPLVTGILGNPDPAAPNSQYFPYHNHDDYKATNWGVYPGGMFTIIRTDP